MVELRKFSDRQTILFGIYKSNNYVSKAEGLCDGRLLTNFMLFKLFVPIF